MKPKKSCIPIWLLMSIVCFCSFLGCMDFPNPFKKADIELLKKDIMPNETRFISTHSNAGIEGSWFWYKNVESTINRVYLPENGKDWYRYNGEDDESNFTAEIKESDRFSLEIVKRICMDGQLESEPSASQSAYAGIGFNVCGPFPDKDPRTHISQPLGKCFLKINNEPLIKSFLGISFTIKFPDGKPENSRLVVQFRERGYNVNSRQPECTVFDTTGTPKDARKPACTPIKENEAQHEYQYEAWQGETIRRPSETDSDPDTEGPNMAALMAIQFELLSGNSKPTNYEFCLSDLKAIYADTPLKDIADTDPYLGEDLVDTFMPMNGPCLSEITERATDEDELWAYAKDTEDEDTGDEGTDDKEFWIMKKEVAAGQFSQCVDADDTHGCTEPRAWETCSTHRYRQLQREYDKLLAEYNNRVMEYDPNESAKAFEVLELKKEAAANNAKAAANCVSWYDANKFCEWIGGQLPSKEQWEYAARSGKSLDTDESTKEYPWPFDYASPNCERAIITDNKGPGCGAEYTPVKGCTKSPQGDTATGVCDMIGNLSEWVSDTYWKIRDEDITAGWDEETIEWVREQEYRTIKGGHFNNWYTVQQSGWEYLRIATSTSMEHPVEPHAPTTVGFRCIMYRERHDQCEQRKEPQL